MAEAVHAFHPVFMLDTASAHVRSLRLLLFSVSAYWSLAPRLILHLPASLYSA